jgi:hypothetical protein
MEGWGGLLIGLSGIIIGTIIALLIYRASRIGPRPVYQVRSLKLIGKEEQALPEEVEIFFKGRTVPRLTKTHVILWNSGNDTLDGGNIVVDDPLRFEYSERAEVLRSRVLKITRDTNKFAANINPNSTNEVICSFDYLEAGDGAIIELLHSAEESYPKVRGAIRGVPKGPLNWGRISRGVIGPFKNRIMVLFIILLGVLFVCLAIIFPMVPKFPESADLITDTVARWILVLTGLSYVLWPSYKLWINRKRFPKSLAIEDIEE